MRNLIFQPRLPQQPSNHVRMATSGGPFTAIGLSSDLQPNPDPVENGDSWHLDHPPSQSSHRHLGAVSLIYKYNENAKISPTTLPFSPPLASFLQQLRCFFSAFFFSFSIDWFDPPLLAFLSLSLSSQHTHRSPSSFTQITCYHNEVLVRCCFYRCSPCSASGCHCYPRCGV
ncbi:hypothetical protein DL93DRAFT_687220 [Clavulina sp. PMI_390]|nr:hypothetical protein DL93DRAFT_687220 [Clavulina sp. PMI_390]